MANITREHCDGNRYLYDSGLCRTFAQIDTKEDASYYGSWACPQRLIIFSFCEGDCTTTQCENIQDFREQLQKIRDYHVKNETWLGVDPMFRNVELWQTDELREFLHPSEQN